MRHFWPWSLYRDEGSKRPLGAIQLWAKFPIIHVKTGTYSLRSGRFTSRKTRDNGKIRILQSAEEDEGRSHRAWRILSGNRGLQPINAAFPIQRLVHDLVEIIMLRLPAERGADLGGRRNDRRRITGAARR